MSVGGQPAASQIDNLLTNFSVQMRNLFQGISNLNTQVNGQGNGLAYLGQIGYSTVPSAQNPGGVSNAQLAQNMIAYLNTMAGVYYGTVQQGGTNGTGATTYNFNNQLSMLWAGQ